MSVNIDLDKALQLQIDLDDLRDERKRKKKMSEPLITKFRPLDFDECYGNQVTIRNLKEAVSNPNHPHCYLLTGKTGVGKTTLARIIASKVNATVDEKDIGSNSGVDFTKDLVAISGFKPLELEKGKPNRLIILDEAHQFSKQAWGPLLKITEEPPPWLYFCFCTTEPSKVIETIKSRSYPVDLKPLKYQEIDQLITDIAEIEHWTLNNDVANGIIAAAEGSARMAITILQAGHSCQSLKELSEIVAKVADDSSPEIELCKYLISGRKEWRPIATLLAQIDDYDAALLSMTRYLSAAMVRSEEAQAHDIWILLQKLMKDVSWDKKVQLYAGVGGMLWGTIPF